MSSPSPTTTTPTRTTPSVCHRRERLRPPTASHALCPHATPVARLRDASGTPRKHTATNRAPPRARRTHAAVCACVYTSRPHTPSASRSVPGPPQRGMAASIGRQRINPQPHTEPSRPRTSCVCRFYPPSSTPRTRRATHGHEDRTRPQPAQPDADDRRRAG
ncbi:hypothetical protein PLICRDRAFT_172130 [Plicaturopsis crispa FD-325 SS-3]|nr:hypothetical protein PLICRDRAFT_172130 [Plicaturopsis crispa FD-325 SS-3]